MIDLSTNPFNLNDEQIQKVTKICSDMTLDEKIGQLFCPIGSSFDEEQIKEFIEKYNSANEKTKVGLNIQKVFDAINNEDYEYVYNKLDNTFKQTNFKTVQELKNYVIQNFSGKQLKYGECQQQGSLYIFDITITEGTKQTNKRVIMQLKDGTDFVMSFNVN